MRSATKTKSIGENAAMSGETSSLLPAMHSETTIIATAHKRAKLLVDNICSTT